MTMDPVIIMPYVASWNGEIRGARMEGSMAGDCGDKKLQRQGMWAGAAGPKALANVVSLTRTKVMDEAK